MKKKLNTQREYSGQKKQRKQRVIYLRSLRKWMEGQVSQRWNIREQVLLDATEEKAVENCSWHRREKYFSCNNEKTSDFFYNFILT